MPISESKQRYARFPAPTRGKVECGYATLTNLIQMDGQDPSTLNINSWIIDGIVLDYKKLEVIGPRPRATNGYEIHWRFYVSMLLKWNRAWTGAVMPRWIHMLPRDTWPTRLFTSFRPWWEMLWRKPGWIDCVIQHMPMDILERNMVVVCAAIVCARSKHIQVQLTIKPKRTDPTENMRILELFCKTNSLCITFCAGEVNEWLGESTFSEMFKDVPHRHIEASIFFNVSFETRKSYYACAHPTQLIGLSTIVLDEAGMKEPLQIGLTKTGDKIYDYNVYIPVDFKAHPEWFPYWTNGRIYVDTHLGGKDFCKYIQKQLRSFPKASAIYIASVNCDWIWALTSTEISDVFIPYLFPRFSRPTPKKRKNSTNYPFYSLKRLN